MDRKFKPRSPHRRYQAFWQRGPKGPVPGLSDRSGQTGAAVSHHDAASIGHEFRETCPCLDRRLSNAGSLRVAAVKDQSYRQICTRKSPGQVW